MEKTDVKQQQEKSKVCLKKYFRCVCVLRVIAPAILCLCFKVIFMCTTPEDRATPCALNNKTRLERLRKKFIDPPVQLPMSWSH